jgi:hypothetical protein
MPEVNKMDFTSTIAPDGSLLVVCRLCGHSESYDYDDPREVLAVSAEILIRSRTHRAFCTKK